MHRCVTLGTEAQLQALLGQTQEAGVLTTAGIERPGATFRARRCALVRRSRALARQLATLHQVTSLAGTVATCCTPHRTLSQRAHAARTPAMAAAITYQVAPSRWTPPQRRGRRSRQLQAFIARWAA